MEDEYNKYNPNLESFFEDSLKGNFNKLSIILFHILSDLKQGKKIELQIKGYASPLHEKQYNINLSKRRIKSFINYVELYQGKVFSSYLENGNFQITELPFGENNAANSVSDNPLVFMKENEVISAGQFHAEAVAHSLDIAAISIASLSNLSERRIFSLLKGDYGLPEFLVMDGLSFRLILS